MATDYEKKYKEALERAKRLTSDMTTLQKIREFIFPELAESEDERIRKWLIEECQKVINMANPAYDTHKAKEAIAWLEKQKEQNLIMANSPQLKEQKPAEWSEEEKRKLNRIYSIIGWAMDEHAFSSCKKLLGDKEGIELQDFLRSIAKPKQEWSEEDEEILKLLILNIGRYMYFGGMSSERILSFLKSLRPQYHGDVTMTEAYKMGKEAGEASHRKPSEEQMDALERTIHLSNFGLEEDRRKALVSLYEQLKKLM